MVNQIIELSGTPGSGDVENVVDSISPSSGETITTVAYYADGQSNTDYSLLLEEQTLLDRVNGDDLPTASEPHQLDVRLSEGDELKFAVTESGNTTTEVRIIVLAENSNLPE
jgi:hypothetical protein